MSNSSNQMTDDEIMKAMSFGYTVHEIANQTFDYTCERSRVVWYCYYCDQSKVRSGCGGWVCTNCGDIEWGRVLSYSDMTSRRQTSVYKRSWWMGMKLRNLVRCEHIELLVADFMKMVNVLESCKLIRGRNISRYNYYIIRLCHRRGIKLLKSVSDLREGTIKQRFDYNLFGVVYPKLGWCSDDDEYYQEWKFSLNKKCVL